MRSLGVFAIGILMAVPASAMAQLAVRVQGEAAEGPVVARMALPPGIRVAPGSCARIVLQSASRSGARSVAYVVPDPYSGGASMATVVLPAGSRLRGLASVLRVESCAPRAVAEKLDMATGGAHLLWDASVQGGLPHAIRFRSGAEVSSYLWNDRVHHAARGSFLLRNDRNASVTLLVDSPELAVVRTKARYCDGQGTPAAGQPEATYDWYVFRKGQEILVQAFVRQRGLEEWHELHHLEFNVQDRAFQEWAGDGARGEFRAEKKGWTRRRWGALLGPAAEDGSRPTVGLLCPEVRFYDGHGEYGTYIHGEWEAWRSSERFLSAWLWIGMTRDPAASVAAMARRKPARLAFTTVAVDRRIAALRGNARTRWQASVAERLIAMGDLNTARKVAEMEKLDASSKTGVTMARAGDAGLALQKLEGGVRVISLYDHARDRELAADAQPPLLRVLLRNAHTEETAELTSDTGWAQAECAALAGSVLSVRLSAPGDKRLQGLAAVMTARPDAARHGWRWSLRIENRSAEWGIEKVAFPQVAVHVLDEGMSAFYPIGAGVVQPVSASLPRRESLYPNGWCTMQYMAAYSTTARTGLYYAMHDPAASTKSLVMAPQDEGGVLLCFDVPAPDMGKPGTPYVSPAEGVWQLLRGDWFDAARIYRDWVRKHARWFPKLGPRGRTDTPQWMKELCAWAQTGGSPADCVEAVKAMQRALGVPIGFHWYNWHEIPFDNDYPHYFPTKPGVPEAVADLQANNVFVMPYINGRLWDTRDRGMEDFEFTTRALPFATKDRSGSPYIEVYGSKESDGSPVRLAVMCPTTDFWQSTIRSIVLRLMNEVGTRGVYIDQIAAAAPVLCMDASHGHPLGGGSWWTVGGYWPFLRAIRGAMPPDRMITSECAAECYAAMLDGFLTWDWQTDGTVPALPAVYGGAVQYFGRNYAAGASTRDLALCMKMGQQLVFGEQIGWLDPRIAQEEVAGSFLRLVVRTRHRFVPYFAYGEMARPPKLPADVPTVRADWAWYGETWVTTSAVLTGAWRIPSERRLLLLFVNVSDQEVRTRFDWNAAVYGLSGQSLTLSVIRDPDEADAGSARLPASKSFALTLPARSLQAWEIRW